jgi:hypothetical protein
MSTTRIVRWALPIAVALFAVPWVAAAPGAHGPNGEHLDAPAGTPTAGTAPRFEARSEAFELVGRLSGGELSMFINRFETNEPVNDAKVELELGTLKAAAPFDADQGDYAVADEAFLKALAEPGDHALVITVVASNESDLLEGTLNVPAHTHVDDHVHEQTAVLVLLAIGALAVVGWTIVRRRARVSPAFGGVR